MMTMLYLFVSLFASQLFLVAPLVIGKEQVENKEVSPFSDAEAPPFFKMANEAREKVHLLQRLGANVPAVHYQVKRSSTGRTNRDIPPAKAENDFDDCRREDMIVNTTQLGLPGKHVTPESFNAYQCKGKCSLKQWKKYIIHSLLKDYLEEKRGIKPSGDVCCIPTKLRPMSVKYYAENGGFVVRTFRDMIVEECGCY